MKNSLAKKFLTYFYGSGIGLVIGILTTVVSTRILSPEDFGKASMFTLAISILMVFIIFGTDQAFVRFFYEEQIELRNKLLFNTMKIPFLLMCIVFLILIIFQDDVMFFLFGETNMFVFYTLLVSVIFQVIYRFAVLVIRMQQKGHMYSLMEILNKSLGLILILVMFYLMGSQYEILIYSTGITLVILSIVAIFLEKSFWNPIRKENIVVKHSQMDIFSFSYPLVLTTLITWLFQAFDKIAIRHWSDFEELGLYSAAFRIVALLMVVQATFTTFWSPVCYEHYEKNPNDTAFFSKASRVISFLMFIIAIITILLKDVIVFLLGPEFREAAIIMPFLIFMPIMYTLSETTVIGINFSKKVKWHIVIAGVACLVNIIGNILLVPIYGAAGAAVSTGISYIIFFMLRTHISLKYYVVDYGLKRVYFIILCLSVFGLQNMVYPHSISTYVTGVFLLLLVIALYSADLKFLIQMVKSKANKI